jgi:hypothetical protein
MERKPESRSQSTGLSGVRDTENPPGQVGPTYLFSVVTSFVAYIIFAVLSGPVSKKDKREVEPHAMEGTQHNTTEEVSEGVGTTVEQNVQFVDTNPGYQNAEKANFDPVRDQALLSDASLDEFFARPIKIASFDWLIGGSALHQSFNPWSLYFQNPRVINRLANYKLMRSKLHVKITISGTQFHYGRALLSYNPFPIYDDYTVDRVALDTDLIAATQRPHILLDPSTSQGGDMVLPFFYYKNVWDITTSDWREMGEMLLVQMNELKHANGGTDPITVNVFAWAEEAKFAIPTNLLPDTFVVQAQGSDEYSGPVSRVAGIVASAAGKLTSVPPLAAFARATEIGAAGVGALATLFGYSRPVDIQHSQFRPNTKSSFAVTNKCDDVMKLTVDEKQELSIDPRTAGLGDVDELGINYIASKQSYFTQFAWPVGGATESLLYNQVVEPGIWRYQGSEIHFPACSFASQPFKYWRGSMKYRFQVVCSSFHKGRIKIVYDPSNTGHSTGTEYNTAYTTVVDISDTTDFEITVGWGQALSYRQILPIASLATNNFFATTPLSYSSSTATYGNGTIAVYVVNELTVPNSLVNNDVAINVWVSAGDDFEVAQPNGERMSRLRLTDPSNLVQPQGFEVEPQGMDEALDSKPTSSAPINTNGALTQLSDQTNHIHFGENIRSFRQLVKRYNIHEFLQGRFGVGSRTTRYTRPALPFEPGYSATSSANITLPLVVPTGTAAYAYGYMTLIKYLSCAYGGWKGGIRYVIDTSEITNPSSIVAGILVEDPTRIPGAFAVSRGDMGTAAARASNVATYYVVNGHGGITLQSTDVNNTVAFEVPYYSNYRFTPAKQRIKFNATMFNQPYYELKLNLDEGLSTDRATTYVAAAEDWTCFMYLGPPVFYYEASAPSI